MKGLFAKENLFIRIAIGFAVGIALGFIAPEFSLGAKFIGEYDYYVVNDVREEAFAQVRSIIAAELQRVPDKVLPIIRKYEKEQKGE